MNNVRMFTIDLLKGQGIPVRSRPENIAVTAVTLAVPAIIGAIMFGYYMRNSIAISIQKQEIASYETRINKLSEAAALQKAFEEEKKVVNGCLSEAAATINKHTQWTPVLIEIIKNMPDSILLTGINVREDNVKKKEPSKNKSGEMVEVDVPVRILQINACENSGPGYGQSIRDFQDRLRASPLFSSRLDNISVSQGVDTLKRQDVVSYQINCAFKPGL
jgi:ribosomal protein L24